LSDAARLRAAIGRIAVPTPAGDVTLTASFGVTVAARGVRADAESMVRAADSALYRAKNNGRDRVEFEALAEALAVR
jgi:diguanylate cyclase (GGDEF)-like protein